LRPVHLGLHALLKAVHLFLPTLWAVPGVASPTSHSPAPYRIAEGQDAQRPEHHETNDDEGDPGGFADIVQPICKGHGSTM
jgi:hypothetical protein